ncbi:MAG: Crp/Fnr family transcriptional regulator [Burkholderiales bacterium]
MEVSNRKVVANDLLDALSKQDSALLLAGQSTIQVDIGEILYERGDTVRYAYFPCGCLVSLLAAVEENMTLEVGLIGREGMLDIAVALGCGISHVRAVVQSAGAAVRIESAYFREQLKKNPSLQMELNRYTRVVMLQLMQTAVCSRFHVLEARFARSLLTIRDRLQSDEFHLTHEFLSHTLGVRRVGVTKAACALQQLNLISYHRGEIRILDGKGLETCACSCYRIAKDCDRRY